jgi:hypothetical protein
MQRRQRFSEIGPVDKRAGLAFPAPIVFCYVSSYDPGNIANKMENNDGLGNDGEGLSEGAGHAPKWPL